ncbi:hypothetical protein MRX96_019562 [Rhipicephalus microplus]
MNELRCGLAIAGPEIGSDYLRETEAHAARQAVGQDTGISDREAPIAAAHAESQSAANRRGRGGMRDHTGSDAGFIQSGGGRVYQMPLT